MSPSDEAPTLPAGSSPQSEDAFSQRLSRAFNESAGNAAMTLLATIVAIGASVETGSALVTVLGGGFAAIVCRNTFKSFAEGLAASEEEKPVTSSSAPKPKP